MLGETILLVKGVVFVKNREWANQFKEVILRYNKHRISDPFMSWFREQKQKGVFANAFEKVLIILIDSRFDQQTKAESALENTKRVFKAGILKTQLERSEIPELIPRRFMSSQEWAGLFAGAIPRLYRLASEISGRSGWDADELLSLMQSTSYKVPYLGTKTSRLAVRWLYELVPDTKINMSNFEIPIDILVYRVASRLGIINPHVDTYSGKGSPADVEIQSFAKTIFPNDPWFLDEPLWSSGRQPSDGGHCYPTAPNHKGCIFEEICPKMYVGFDPAKIGMESDLGTGRSPKLTLRKGCDASKIRKHVKASKEGAEVSPRDYVCGKCQREHSRQEFKESRFCRNCGSWLSRSTLGISVHEKLLESEAELEEAHSLGRGLIYNDYSGSGSRGKDFNVLHKAGCVTVLQSKTNYRKFFFSDIDRAIEWLETNRGKEGKNWKRCGTCKPGIYPRKR